MRYSAITILAILLSPLLSLAGTFKAIPMKTGDKFGFINANGKTLIEPVYTNVGFAGDLAFLVYIDNKCGLVDSNGKEVVAPTYKSIENKGEGYWAVVDENSKRALMNPSYKVVSDFTYSSFYYIGDGLFAFQKEKLWGYMDGTGKEVIPATYDYCSPFRFGKCKVSQFTDLDGKRVLVHSIIDKTGKKLMTENHEIEILSATKIFHSAPTPGQNSNQIYITDITGKKTNELSCEGKLEMSGSSFDWHEGLAKFKCNGKEGFVDENLKVVIEAKYDKVGAFYSGVAAVQENSKWYYINKKGEKLFDYIYTVGYMGAPSFYSSSIAIVDPQTKLWGIMNKAGKLVIPASYEQTKFVSEKGFYGAQKGELWGIVDQNNKTVIPFVYEYIEETYFDSGLMKVKKNGNYFFIDTKGKEYIK